MSGTLSDPLFAYACKDDCLRYSLLSRFQGAFLAAALGEELEHYSTGMRSQQISHLGITQSDSAATLYRWQPGTDRANVPASSAWGKIALQYAQNLACTGSWQTPETRSLSVSPLQNGMGGGHQATAAQLAIALLPLFLFFHESQTILEQQLSRAIQELQGRSGSLPIVLTMGCAIAEILKEQMDRHRFLPHLIGQLEKNPAPDLADVIERLNHVQTLILQGTCLQTAVLDLRQTGRSDPDHDAIALAFYCFLSTPENLRLSLLRAVRAAARTPGVCALVGALVGACHSVSALPLPWALTVSAPDHQLIWGISSADLADRAAHLLAAWSGLYDPSAWVASSPAIAAAGVLRPR
jgi:hypothetical protein